MKHILLFLIFVFFAQFNFAQSDVNYDESKESTVSLAEKFTDIDIPYERKHDIADAVCMLLYYNFKISVHFFDQFKYSPKV